jgi:PadR family transcriptional regulator PadR
MTFKLRRPALARHGCVVTPETLYPTLDKLEKSGFLTCEARTVDHRRRKYYRITAAGMSLLNQMKRKIEELYEEVVKEE